MHPQARKAIHRMSRSAHSSQRIFILAGVLSTILVVGADCVLKVNSAQAGVIESGDRSTPNPSADPSADSSADLSPVQSRDRSFETSLAVGSDESGFPTIADFPDSPDMKALEQASTARLDLPMAMASPPAPDAISAFETSSVLNLALNPDRSSDQNPAPEVSPAIDASQSPDSAQTEPLSLAQQPDSDEAVADARDANPTEVTKTSLVGEPLVHVQSAYVLQDGESSGRIRATGLYVVTPNLLFGATLDLTAGEGFSDSNAVNLDLNELYVTFSPDSLANLRITAGLIDLTSYFDRNSFAKDSVTHFFNPVFQTNPALAATGIGSRPGALVNWDVTDILNFKAAAFSSSRNLGDFAFDGFAGEVGLRLGNLVVRGTYSRDRDAGQQDGFREIFQFSRGDDSFGLESGDEEEAFGINAEMFIPELNLGLFGRYGHYQNLELDRGGHTYSFGINLLDLFMPDDRLGLAYGRLLSNDTLRQDRGDNIPDVLELFYDIRLASNLRAGATFQQRDGFSDTVLGLRIRADFDLKFRP
ncbi:MAG: porin [Oscillatoriophycideae cyanobacterium NC_groundwater_1537_Pr4_S-0.65um_50_18]|nr:porin [Oscillatoriophycideae cyanobacterium NC_groundwater_1537_Pr4_S-0.65um_50_18]